MTKLEVNTFIEEMKQLGDDSWTPDAVMMVYGNVSLDAARKDHLAFIDRFGSIVDAVLNHSAQP